MLFTFKNTYSDCLFVGDHYSSTYTKESLYQEVDTFLKNRYSHAPSILKMIKYEYTDWTRPRPSRYNGSGEYMAEEYQRAQVS